MPCQEVMLCPRSLQDKSYRGIFQHVVTPDRIPRFTIPSLDILEKRRCVGPLAETALGSSSGLVLVDTHGVPGSIPFCSNTELAAGVQAIPDRLAWAALSLPHLPKVTTPYGFVTLGQSPQVTWEEALFFHAGHPRAPAAEIHPRSWQEPGHCRHLGVPGAAGDGCSHTGGGQRDHKRMSASATGPMDAGGSQALPPPQRCAMRGVLEGKEAKKTERRLMICFLEVGSSLELPAGKPRKNLLQRFLKRPHAPRQLKPLHFTRY
nr:C2 calcium-dependent domain-containing protein 4C-like [Anser cygnoides]